MIDIAPGISLEDDEISMDFVRASGPGGQNVNKVSSAVQLRFDVAHSPSLPEDVRARLVQLGGRRVTEDGVLILDARRFRTQERNRQDALDRLADLIRQATHRPKRRRKTRPSRAAKQRRLEGKRHQSDKKRLRGRVSHHED
ncbi:MAG: aminoacyl-tRNA hydrolase [Nitrospiraceae bacterium]|nr:aminoacyl-tRNA hydrolase [Nitrospiraceae bacterium]